MRALPTCVKVGETPLDTVDLLVFLDGIEQRYVTEFDTIAGYLVRYVVEPRRDGDRFVRFKVVDGDMAKECVEGVVTLAWRDDA